MCLKRFENLLGVIILALFAICSFEFFTESNGSINGEEETNSAVNGLPRPDRAGLKEIDDTINIAVSTIGLEGKQLERRIELLQGLAQEKIGTSEA